MERSELNSPSEISAFVLAGKSVFTLQNENTGNRFTFRVSKKTPKPFETDDGVDLWFVGVLSGPDNTSNYTYLGLINDRYEFKVTAKSPKNATSLKVFQWFWKHVHIFGSPSISQVRFYHEGRCGRCGRSLTVPDSVKSGYGPECITKIGR